MYFSRVTLMPHLLSRTEKMTMFGGSAYSDHQLLWRMFSSEQRGFLFRKEYGGHNDNGLTQSLPVYYVVSDEVPNDTLGLDIATKEYNPVIDVGMTFGFSLRANPVVAHKIEGRKNNSRRDVLLVAKAQAKEQGVEPLLPMDLAAKKWLLQRTENAGFSVEADQLLHDGHIMQKFSKKGAKAPITISMLDYDGLLTVTDVDLFRKTLFEGIGRARGFGCGMMMIRKVA